MVWKPHVTVAAVVEREGKFLLVEEESAGSLVYNQPAGHLEEGESLVHAVIRETLEETAWHFEPAALLGIYRWPHPTKAITYIRFAFTGVLLSHDEQRDLDKGIIRALWMTRDEILAMRKSHRSPQVQQCIDDYTRGQRIPLEILKEFS
jgi:ADP-ribose pyrophosphatase YjhB (NUDIX family)